MGEASGFEVSVIIPVYNAEKYVERAIRSALQQDEVREVVVVDDGYADGALEICNRLAAPDARVKVYRHPNGENRGAGATRNCGILHASCEYIAFLDADDYYLPERFKHTRAVFQGDPKVEAVYEPVGVEFTSEAAKTNFLAIKPRVKNENDLTTFLSYPIEPYSGNKLFLSLIQGKNDGPHTDGVTLKKSLIGLAGLFNPALKLHQDTEYWIRVSFNGTFSHSGHHLTPVAIRTMHEENRTYGISLRSSLILWKSVLSWATQLNPPLRPDVFDLIMNRYKKLVEIEQKALGSRTS